MKHVDIFVFGRRRRSSYRRYGALLALSCQNEERMGRCARLALDRGSVDHVCGSARPFLRVGLVSLTQSIVFLVPISHQLYFALVPTASYQRASNNGRP